MTDYQDILLQLLSKALFDRPVTAVKSDWLKVLSEAKNQAVMQLAYVALDRGVLSPEEEKKWTDCALSDLVNSIRVIHDHSVLHEWMSEDRIPYVILKGYASAFYYPVPEYRTMGDVDFLVPAEYLDRAGTILKKHGLKPWEEKHISHIVYRNPPMHLEMHFNLAGTPDGKNGEIVKEYSADVFEKAVLQNIDNDSVMLPSPFHHGLILLLHTCHHLTGEGIGLRHLCDWAVFENHFSDEEFRSLFEDKLKKIGLWYFAQVLTLLSIRYLGAEKRDWADIGECSGLLEELMQDILNGGNFGVKDKERSNEAYIISSRGKNGVGKTSIGAQIIVSLNNVVYTRWPFAKKWKIVLPAGWLYYGIKQLIRIAKGKRKKVHLRTMLTGAKQRKKVYSQLRLFDTEE